MSQTVAPSPGVPGSPAKPKQEGFGATARRDNWWAGPLATFIVFTAFVIYGNVAVFWKWPFDHSYFEIRQNPRAFSGPEVAPYLAPFYAPLLYDPHSSHAWFQRERPNWWPSWAFFSPALLILIFPLGFRFTCYYYRKAYYRSFWLDPPACAVGEPRKSYWGENHWPLLIQNVHRYFMYFAVLFVFMLGWDALKAFWWPTDRAGNPLGGGHQFGVGVGTILMVVNVILIAGYTFGCHSLRHIIGGRLNCFSCPVNNGKEQNYRSNTGYKLWRWVTRLNENHMLWAWLSLISVGFTDFYIRMCAMGVWSDMRII